MQPKNASPVPSEEEEPEFAVEKIVSHRVNKKGKLEYYIKWKGFPNEENTWEPTKNLNCEDLIEKYEEERKKLEKDKPKEAKDGKRKADGSTPAKKKKVEKEGELKVSVEDGFEKGWAAEEILGATETLGELYFLIKWKDNADATLLAAKTVNVKIPQMVIAFYEARTTWDNKGKGKKNVPQRDDPV